MPLCFNRSNITSLLKRSGLDKEYMTISNFPFISKPIEKVEARHIEDHLEHNVLNDRYQSAYRRGHSAETALLKVDSDIAEDLDEGSMNGLIMFALFVAFDIIDRSISLKRLEFSLWNQGRGLNFGEVVPRRQNALCFSVG